MKQDEFNICRFKSHFLKSVTLMGCGHTLAWYDERVIGNEYTTKVVTIPFKYIAESESGMRGYVLTVAEGIASDIVVEEGETFCISEEVYCETQFVDGLKELLFRVSCSYRGTT